MKTPFNKILGPGVEWIDDDGAKRPDGFAEDATAECRPTRDEFMLRSLNAAVNLPLRRFDASMPMEDSTQLCTEGNSELRVHKDM